jgi:UDP-N-acetylmuramoylalanine--D-glutamate ligase
VRDLRDKNVLMLGMADSGAAAVEFLLRLGARVTACDRKPLDQLRALGVPFVPQSLDAVAGRDLIVVSPGVPWNVPELEAARAQGIEVAGDIEMASWFLQGPILGITGSVGKTTVTTLVGRMLEKSGVPCQVGGNIGLPLSGMVASSLPGQWNVLELSSFQLEAAKTFHVQIGLALNVTDNHLDRHGTMENYAAAKAKLFAHQTPDDIAVLNAGNSWTRAYARTTPARIVWFSADSLLDSGFWLEGGRLVADGQPFLKVADIAVRGRHNRANILAAAAGARCAGARLEAIAAAAREFRGVEHRLEFVRTVNGVEYFNDSKATTVESVLAAIDSFQGNLWVILGGKDKGSDFRPLRQPLIERARGVLLIGSSAAKIAEQVGPGLPLEMCGDLSAAVASAHAGARPGDTVLLAPACTSWDQYKSYEERGRHFKSLVAALQEAV